MGKQIRAALIAGIVLGLMLSLPMLFAAWTTPRTWVSSEVVTASQMNAHVRDNLNILKTQINDDGTLYARRLTGNTTNVGNVGSGEDDLMSYSIAANTLNTNGQIIHVKALFFLANNANSKRVRFKYGTTGDCNLFPASTSFGNSWLAVDAYIMREGATDQQTWAQGTTTVSGGFACGAAATETLSGAITVKFTGEAVSNDDIVQYAMAVEVMQ